MTLSHGFRQLASAIENLEANGLDVLDVAATDDDPGERLTVDLTVSVPIGADESPTEATVSDEGDAGISAANPGQTERSSGGVRERVLDPLSVRADETNGASAVETTGAGPAEPAGAGTSADGDSSTETDEAGGDDCVVSCPMADCDATFESDHGMKIHRTKVHGDEAGGTDGGTPAYRDPERLREAYADCDSFPEMREALGTDVSTQTVRRQTIAHDIYVPGESDSDSGADDERAEESADGRATDGTAQASDEANEGDECSGGADDGRGSDEGSETGAQTTDEGPELGDIELPEGVSVADLKAAVSSAQTLYDVQQRFDLDRREAMQLLEKYDLLGIVHGRVSNRDDRKQVDEDEITRRILEHASVSQPSRA